MHARTDNIPSTSIV